MSRMGYERFEMGIYYVLAGSACVSNSVPPIKVPNSCVVQRLIRSTGRCIRMDAGSKEVRARTTNGSPTRSTRITRTEDPWDEKRGMCYADYRCAFVRDEDLVRPGSYQGCTLGTGDDGQWTLTRTMQTDHLGRSACLIHG